MLEVLGQVKVPVVLVDREVPAEIHASSVHNDHRSGMAEAVRHLLELGHRHIALIGGSPGTLPGRAREASLREAIAEAGDGVQVTVLAGSFSPDHGVAATHTLLGTPRPPTAIICGSNQVLVGCLRVLHAEGIEVGRGLSIVTCDVIPASELHQPPIAAIGRDTVGLGRTAADLMLRRLRDGEEPETVVLPTTFTPTASCAPPP
jgi:LacI family transcriptional regulator